MPSVTEAIAEESGAEVQMVYGDLTDPAAVERIVGEINAKYGQIDILVANAGGDIGAGGTMAAGGGKPEPNDAVFIPLEDVRAVMDRNLLSLHPGLQGGGAGHDGATARAGSSTSGASAGCQAMRAGRSTRRRRRPSTSTPAAWRRSFGRTTSRSTASRRAAR